MQKKAVFRILLFIFIAILFAGLCVFTFVDFRSFKKVYYSVNYETTVGGKIVGSVKQSVQKGKDAETVTAVPDEGYRFLRWADTCSPNPERTDTNIVKDIKPQAKFVKISDIKYKILLVHVTEVQATFKDKNGNDVVADYKMDEKDLQVCKMTTELLDVCLNELLDGFVTFEIDEYYTKEIMRKENFEDYHFDENDNPSLYPSSIPEVAEKLKDYDTAITTVPLNDPDHALRGSVVGITNESNKTAMVYLNITQNSMSSGENIKCYDLINAYNDYDWVRKIEPYVHEFVHTLESRVDATWQYPYHKVITKYVNEYKGEKWYANHYDYIISKLYLLNQAEYEGKTVGIPFPVFTNEIYNLHYISGNEYMGTALSRPISVAKGCDGEEVQAIAYAGYKFVSWSDGVLTSKRIDKNIQGDMEFIAYFEPDKYTVNYIATEGGKIVGYASHTMYGNCHFEHVTGVAEEGYRFVGWSDGKESAQRMDRIDAVSVLEFNKNNNELVLTAIFEKVN